MSDRPRALLFDLGRVLVAYDPEPALRALARRVGAAPAAIRAWALDPLGPIDAFGRGRIDEIAFYQTFAERFGADASFDATDLRRDWLDMFAPIDGALELIDRLRPQAPLALVSNTNAAHFQYLDARFGLRSRFDVLALSHERGALKPEAEIYEYALRALAVTAEEAWFTDDLPENLEGARRLGMRTHRCTGLAGLYTALTAMGFEVDPLNSRRTRP